MTFGERIYAEEKKRDTFVELPDYLPAEFRTTHVGKLRKALYGTRPAAASWGDEFRKGLVSCSLTVGNVSRCSFHYELCSVAGEVADELGLSKSKPVSSPATADGAARCQDDEFMPFDEEQKRLYQRIVAKLNYLAHDRLDLKYATFCLASAVVSPRIGNRRAAKRVGRYLRKAPVAWQGFLFHDPRPEELLCYTNADWASNKPSRRSTSGGVVTLGGGVLNCWAKKQRSVALSSWESELLAAITSGTRS